MDASHFFPQQHQLHATPHTRRAVVAGRSARRQVTVRAQPLPQAFMAMLQQSLDREQQRVADRIGIPSLQLSLTTAGSGDATGGLVWTAGVHLAALLNSQHRDELRGTSVIELGAGTGVVGITCACLGAHVTMTDVASVLPVARANVETNAQLFEAAGGSASVAELEWQRPDPGILSRRFDWVLASDVTYERSSIPILSRLLCQLLAASPQAIALLAHQRRSRELDQYMEQEFLGQGLLLQPLPRQAVEDGDGLHSQGFDEAIVFFRVKQDDLVKSCVSLADTQA